VRELRGYNEPARSRDTWARCYPIGGTSVPEYLRNTKSGVRTRGLANGDGRVGRHSWRLFQKALDPLGRPRPLPQSLREGSVRW